jgi:hypothetical protein
MGDRGKSPQRESPLKSTVAWLFYELAANAAPIRAALAKQNACCSKCQRPKDLRLPGYLSAAAEQ